jgi:hypothetical protein
MFQEALAMQEVRNALAWAKRRELTATTSAYVGPDNFSFTINLPKDEAQAKPSPGADPEDAETVEAYCKRIAEGKFTYLAFGGHTLTRVVTSDVHPSIKALLARLKYSVQISDHETAVLLTRTVAEGLTQAELDKIKKALGNALKPE